MRALFVLLPFFNLFLGVCLIDLVTPLQIFDFVAPFTWGMSPWTFLQQSGDISVSVFPYPPLMLYLYKLILMLTKTLGLEGGRWLAFFYLLPTFFADIGIAHVFRSIFPRKSKTVLFFYCCSPIVVYSMYICGHLDLLALFFMLLALFCLRQRRFSISAIMLAASFGFKLPSLFALPLILVFLAKSHPRDAWRYSLQYFSIFIAISCLISAPFLFTRSYWDLVLFNPQKNVIFSLFLQVGEHRIYCAYLALILLYARFVLYEKINFELLCNFLALIYSVFVLLVPPMENWYAWNYIPCALLLVKISDESPVPFVLGSFFFLTYLAYFLALPLGIDSQGINLIFSTFQGILLIVVYILYRFGIRSNQVYRKKGQAMVIGIGGDSGAGKTRMKQSILDLLGERNVLPIEADGDHKWERGNVGWEKFTHLNPKANHLYRQARSLEVLKKGGSVERVEYDHKTGRFTAPQKVESNEFILLSGLHPFYLPQTRKLVDVKIYMDTEEKLRRHWKILRDTEHRGYRREYVLRHIDSRVKDAQQYILPQREFADIIVRFFTVEDYEEGDPSALLRIQLMLRLRLDIELESLVDKLEPSSNLIHTYDPDLQFQTLVLREPIPQATLESAMETLIPNREEIFPRDIVWDNGYHAFLQLVVALVISQGMRCNDSMFS